MGVRRWHYRIFRNIRIEVSQKMTDLLLKGGEVIDPSQNIRGNLDLAVKDGVKRFKVHFVHYRLKVLVILSHEFACR